MNNKINENDVICGFPKTEVIGSLTCCILLIGLSLLFWSRLPATLPVHFNGAGEPDSWMPKFMALTVLPLIVIGAEWLCIFSTQRETSALPQTLRNYILWLFPAIQAVMISVIISHGLGYPLNAGYWAYLLAAFMLIFIGNYMPKAKPNNIFGLRIPGLAKNRTAWNQVQRTSGKVLVAVGICMLLLNILHASAALLACLPLCTILGLVLYAFWVLHRTNQDK